MSAQPFVDACMAAEEGSEACSSAAARLAFGKAAFPEELFKWFFVWSVPRFRGRNMMEMARTRRALSQRLVLYTVTISLGFSMTENLLLFSALDPKEFEGGSEGSNWLYTLWLLRAVLLTPMHALAGSITALGRARVLYHPSTVAHGSSGEKIAWDLAVQLSHFAVAVAMHAIYDFWAYWNEISIGKAHCPGDAFTIQALYWTVSFFLVLRFLCMGVTVDTLRAQLYRGSGEDVQVPFIVSGRLEPDPHFADGMRIMRGAGTCALRRERSPWGTLLRGRGGDPRGVSAKGRRRSRGEGGGSVGGSGGGGGGLTLNAGGQRFGGLWCRGGRWGPAGQVFPVRAQPSDSGRGRGGRLERAARRDGTHILLQCAHGRDAVGPAAAIQGARIERRREYINTCKW